ncbi:transglutaminase family protein [Bradyrhizobium manausense]|uniref:transglutaminase family protein n=1 Tax=Bradyrhizobium TaxID=374 RepID=UPI001BAAEFAF|nr:MULTISPECIES: transglutaminase family protein [Bradyrhizobium]MBR0830735.1 transglutaminase family protein [Bradyrhizobium manausense]UVO28725.1 transglutaminase family protein [Bradyrhizobium arachidis]
MAVLFEIEHITTYKYANPVTFGTHKAMFLPRPAAQGRLIDWSVRTNPPSRIRWTSDALSNNVTTMEFSEPGKELSFAFRFKGIHFGAKGVENFPLERRAEEIPVQYSLEEWTDLLLYIRPHTEDPDASVAAWAKSFIASNRTSDVLLRMLDAFRDTFRYNAREAEGTQSPGETLQSKSGTCRDYAWLMIEALRRLGFGSRFVSGYLYDAALDGGQVGMAGSGATHAWLQVFLPGAGWMNYDPTNRINAGYDLIPVAIARHPGQAIPLAGSWFGEAGDYLGMSVKVTVQKLGDVSDPSEA